MQNPKLRYFKPFEFFDQTGANSAGQPAVFLAERARRVFLLIRGDDINKGMSRYLSRRIEQTDNIEILTNTEIAPVSGGSHLEAVEIKNNRTGETRRLNAPAIFTSMKRVASAVGEGAMAVAFVHQYLAAGPGLRISGTER